MPKVTIDCGNFAAALQSLADVSQEERAHAVKAVERMIGQSSDAEDVNVCWALRECGLSRVYPSQMQKWRVQYDKSCAVAARWLASKANFEPNDQGETFAKVTLDDAKAEEALVDVKTLAAPPAGYDVNDWYIVDQVIDRGMLGRGVEATKVEKDVTTDPGSSSRIAMPGPAPSGSRAALPDSPLDAVPHFADQV
jgi:hypothetical protein